MDIRTFAPPPQSKREEYLYTITAVGSPFHKNDINEKKLVLAGARGHARACKAAPEGRGM
jgi:hypothetical protein